MYSRFWNMFLYDLGVVCEEEPFRKLVNQSDREIGIRAERVIGLVRIEEEAVRELPEAVRSDANRYISRMALLEDSGEGKQLAYVLDPCSLTPHSE